jgi:uncharacterized membrane protein
MQNGILALGTASHAYLEFDARQEGTSRELVTAMASLREPQTTMGGVNLVAGFRLELWRALAPAHTPRGLEGFNHDLVGVAHSTIPHEGSGLTMKQPVLLERLEHLSQEPNPVLVEHARERAESVQNRIADRITAFAGSMRFVYIHILWFGAWIGFRIEKYPFGLLTMIVSLEAIFLSTFVMISQNRADAKRQVIADQEWQTVKEEDRQNEELIKLSNQILELTKAIHNYTSPHSNRT